jgi:GYF domain 2
MQWYYLSDTHERIAASEEQFPLLVSRGVVRATTMIWRRGMSGWSSCGQIKPELFSAALAGGVAQNHPAADAIAVRGTVTGLARTLAGYAVWFRIAGVLCLMLCLSVMTALAQAGFVTYDRGVRFLFDYLPWSQKMAEMDAVNIYFWAHFAVAVIGAFILCMLGVLLLRAASRAIQARETGSEAILTAALRNAGAWFVTAVVWVLFNALCWGALTLWMEWDNVWKKDESKPAAPAVAV